MRIAAFALGALLAVGAEPAMAATNIVINGSFEDQAHPMNGWQYGAWGDMEADLRYLGAYDGAYYAFTSCNISCPMTQTLATEAGAKYDLTFGYNPAFYSGQAGQKGGTELQVLWDGTLIKDIPGGPEGWVTYTVDDLVAPGVSTDLTFVGIKDADQVGLDGVSVTQVPGVPEPATWTMLILGFGMMGTMLRAARSQGVLAA